MLRLNRNWAIVAAFTVMFGAASVRAADRSDTGTGNSNIVPSKELPPAESSHDPLPPVPSPVSNGTSPGVVQQAGVGSEVAYGRGGVLELGGGLTWSQADQSTLLAITPTLGWFFTDNVELSGIVQLHYNRSGNQASTFVTALAEPSLHLPIVDNAFIFGGLGVGATYDNSRRNAGFALAPRIGFNVLVGRSGVLTPSATMNWSSNQTVQTSGGTLVAVNSTWGANVNYTVMW